MLVPVITKSITIGLLISIPVWPVGMYCLRRGLSHGKLSALLSGLGAALANAIGIFLTLYCLKSIAGFIAQEKMFFDFIAGGLLFAIGIRGLWKIPPDHQEDRERADPEQKDYRQKITLNHYARLGEFFLPFLFIITNPLTYASLSAVSTVFNLLDKNIKIITALQISAGVFAGSALLWSIMSNIIDSIRTTINDVFLQRINTAGNLLILLIGITLILDAVIVYH
ncbi:MAG: hypothetical protein ACOWWO_16100 [Peptococcaceae bacterium]